MNSLATLIFHSNFFAFSQFELDRRDQELRYREESLREWSINLHEKENEYKRR